MHSPICRGHRTAAGAPPATYRRRAARSPKGSTAKKSKTHHSSLIAACCFPYSERPPALQRSKSPTLESGAPIRGRARCGGELATLEGADRKPFSNLKDSPHTSVAALGATLRGALSGGARGPPARLLSPPSLGGARPRRGRHRRPWRALKHSKSRRWWSQASTCDRHARAAPPLEAAAVAAPRHPGKLLITFLI